MTMRPAPRPARTLVVGLGAIGRRHVRNLQRLGAEVGIVRRGADRAAQAAGEYGVAAFPSLERAAGWKPEAVVIATPTSNHLGIAQWALEHDCHVFVEKPIASSLEGLDDLLALADARGRCLAVGCNLRFHPAIEAIRDAIGGGRVGRLLSARAEVGQYLPDWHPAADYRQEYSARAEMGGGALLTLIHELDYTLWIAGPVVDVVGRRARVSSLEIDVDDVAELICRHASGALTSVHMDFVDRVYNRRSRWLGEEGTIEWSWGGPVRLLGPRGAADTLWHDPAFDYNETYMREIEDFFDAAVSRRAPRTTGRDGMRALDVALGVAVA